MLSHVHEVHVVPQGIELDAFSIHIRVEILTLLVANYSLTDRHEESNGAHEVGGGLEFHK